MKSFEVLEQIDHKNVDKQIDWFREKPSTVENIAVWAAEELQKSFAQIRKDHEDWKLTMLKVKETGKNSATLNLT